MCASADAKRQQAERLALLAEEAELEAQQLELEAAKLRSELPPQPLPPPAPPPAPSPADAEPMALVAPLRWLGPYPAIALSLPDLQSPGQKARMLAGDASAMGVTLDFVVDTAANTNTISAQVAGPTSQGGLELTQIGTVAGGVGAGGTLGGGATYMLGRCELGDAPKDERVVFMSGLSATALPIAAPAAAGLLGVAFLNSFSGGVEFSWGAPPPAASDDGVPAAPTPIGTPIGAPSSGSIGSPATITFYGDESGTESLRDNYGSNVPLTALAGSQLPSLTLRVNGVEMPALLDTGSPITVLNAAAAKAASVEYDASLADAGVEASANPFARIGAAMKAGQAAAKGDVLVVGGASGPVRLVRTSKDVSIGLEPTSSFGDDCRPYVGELPGLAALDGLGASAGPAVILGTDVLRRRPRMWYTPSRLWVQ